MELDEAIKRLIPLQVRLVNRQSPIEPVPYYAAEVFLADTKYGAAVIWLDPFWFEEAGRCHITYADPRWDEATNRWIDQQPRWGPGCIAYQKPVIFERVDAESSAWESYRAWQHWRAGKGDEYGRRAAWKHVEAAYGDRIRFRKA